MAESVIARIMSGTTEEVAVSDTSTAGGAIGGLRRRMSAWPRPRVGVDVGVAAVLTLLAIVSLPAIDEFRAADRPVDTTAFALAVIAASATAGRRRWPRAVLAVVAIATSAYLALGYPYGPIMFCLAVAVYAGGRRLPLLPAAIWAAGTFVVLLAHLFTNEAALGGFAGLAPAAAWVAIPFTLGAARRLVVEAGARERAEADRRLLDAERLRLAQEVHDVVGHGLAAIQMQADIALHMQDSRPEQAGEALQAISKASSEALTELRNTLAAITPDQTEPDLRAPTPGLAKLDALVQRVEDAGLTVAVTITGRPRVLSPAVDLAAYRIMQEALTNVVKHSAHPRAEITIEHRRDEIILRVTNENLDALQHTDGFGITGMRRRVAHLGGSFTAGPGARRDVFEIRATIPTDPPTGEVVV